MQHNLQELNNNLKTLFVDWPGSSAASIQFWFMAGSVLEKKEDFGIAHFLEHMFFKGSEKGPGQGSRKGTLFKRIYVQFMNKIITFLQKNAPGR